MTCKMMWAVNTERARINNQLDDLTTTHQKVLSQLAVWHDSVPLNPQDLQENHLSCDDDGASVLALREQLDAAGTSCTGVTECMLAKRREVLILGSRE